MRDPASRRRFGRQDLDELKQYGRPAVLAALGSFDERELDDREFTSAPHPCSTRSACPICQTPWTLARPLPSRKQSTAPAWSAPDQLGPERFPYAGVAFLRQRADRGDLYLAFDGGPFGRSHQHEDKLGFWLFAHGRSFLVDPGRHLYDSSAASYREYLCSTRAHSTARVDSAGQHSRGHPETWIARQPGGLTWKATDGEIRAAAAYDLGYGEDNAIAVTHRREIVFVRESLWIVFDRFEGEGEHAVDLRFQFAPGPLEQKENRAWTLFPDANLLLWSESSTPYSETRVEEGQENPRGGWYSPRYAPLETAPCLSLTARATLPLRTATLLFPYRHPLPPDLSFTLEECTAVVQSEYTGEVRVDCSRK